MTSFPALALPASASRRRSSAPRARPRARPRRCQVNDDQLPRRQLARLSIDKHGGTCEPWGPWGPQHDDQLPRRWPCRRQLPAVDRRHHGHGRGGGPGAARSTMTSFPGVSLPGCRSTGTAARANRRDRGDRSTMTSFPGAGLAGVSFPPSIVGTTGTAAGEAPALPGQR